MGHDNKNTNLQQFSFFWFQWKLKVIYFDMQCINMKNIYIYLKKVWKISFDHFLQVLPFIKVISNECTQLYNMFYNKN
jgi:hypothetical protein